MRMNTREKRTRTEVPFTTIGRVARLEPGTAVVFFLGGRILSGEISRRAYQVLVVPGVEPLRVPAANVMTWREAA